MPPTCTRLNDSFRTIFELTCILDSENVVGLNASRRLKQFLKSQRNLLWECAENKKSNESGVKWSIARSINLPIS